jgi:hypothetical protein
MAFSKIMIVVGVFAVFASGCPDDQGSSTSARAIATRYRSPHSLMRKQPDCVQKIMAKVKPLVEH